MTKMLPEVRARAVLLIDGQEVTHRQLEALMALERVGSMKKAADSLGISTPVLYKYVKEAEAKAGLPIVQSSSKGTKLTEYGKDLLRKHREMELRLEGDRPLAIAGTLVSERCVLTAASVLSASGIACEAVISTDKHNLRLVDEGRLDCVILDDVLHLMERAEELEGREIGNDVLLHLDRGEEYARLAFGAQRLAFRYLEERDFKHKIVSEIFEPVLLDTCDLSYFVNRSLVRRGVLRAAGAKEQRWSVHSIMAVPCSDHPDVEGFISEARRAGVYPKG